MQTSKDLVSGQVYTRAELQEKFNIRDASIKNGIFRPKGHDSIWLFVTKNKTSDRTQYHDSLIGDELIMQGQTMGRTDDWIIRHDNLGLELLLFYRDSKNEHPGAGFTYEGSFRYRRHHESGPATFTLERIGPSKQSRKLWWELALEAVIAQGGQATPTDVRDYILRGHPDFNDRNVQPDLAALSVNSPSRTSYGPNFRPRRTDEGNKYDRLFKVGGGKGVLFELYDPKEHGVWEIYPDVAATSSSGMSVRRLVDPAAHALEVASAEAEDQGAFEVQNIDDARHREMASIVRRRGQAKFRKSVIEAYTGVCAITGCTLQAILEAAHIHPYLGEQTNVVSNGLLLRSDIHTLFDLGLISVEPETFIVRISPELQESEYKSLDGIKLKSTVLPAQRASSSALNWHRSRCGW